MLQGLRLHHLLCAELEPARNAAEELLAFAGTTRRTGDRLEAHRAVGVVQFHAGELVAARKHFERGIDLHDLKEHGLHALRYEHDPGQTCLSHAGRTLWMLGYPNEAVERSEQAIALARATSHAASVAEAMTWRAEISLWRGELQDAHERATAALAFATDHGLPLWIALAAIMHGWTLSEQNPGEDSIAQMRAGLAKLATTGDRLFRLRYAAILAQALGQSGQVTDGLAAVHEAIGASLRFGATYWNSELLRLRGELLLACDGPDVAASEARFPQAIETAQGQDAKSLELRAATSLARLWVAQAKRAEAHDLLAPVDGWFTEGFDTADLKDAKALLDELR